MFTKNGYHGTDYCIRRNNLIQGLQSKTHHSLFARGTSCTHFELIQFKFPEKMEEIREKFYAGNASATEAFEEMFARLAELEVSRK